MTVAVFIADDHGIVRDGLRFLIEVSGEYQVVGTASDGDEAVEAVLALQPDIAIVDILMPKLDGIEVTQNIRRHETDTKILILSMVSTGRTVREALAAGADGYLLKEAASSELFDALQAIRAGQRYVSPSIFETMVDEQVELITEEEAGHLLAQLSPREKQILPLVVEGLTSIEISIRLGLASSTVDTYRSRLMKKLRARSTADLVRLAIQQGLISEDC